MVRFSLYNTTRKQRIFIAVVALAIAVMAIAAISVCCSHHTYPRELVVADSLCESNPDSAEALLHRMPDSVLAAQPDRIYYDLLRIKASNNLYEPQKDSTIFRIVDFFERYGDKEKLCQAYYYQGKYYVQHNDAPQALKCFQEALDMSDDNTPLAFKSKIYSQSGTIFLDQNLFDEALAMYRRSFQCDSILGDTVNMAHGLRDMAQIYRHLEKNDSCGILLNQAYTLSEGSDNIFLKRTIVLSLVSFYLAEDKVNEAYRLYSNNLMEVEEMIQSPTYASAVMIYDKLGKSDSVYKYCNKIMSVGTPSAKQLALENLIDYYSVKGDLGKVRLLLKKYKDMSDTVRVMNTSETVMQMHSLYNYNLREKENTRLKFEAKEKSFMFVLVAMALGLLCALMFYQRERGKKNYMRIKFMHEHLEQLYKSSCRQYKVSLDLKEKEIAGLMKKIDYLNGGSIEDKEKMRVYDMLRNRIRTNQKLTDKMWEDILLVIDRIYPGLRVKLMGAYGLDKEEFKISVLVKLDLLNMEIATLVCKTPGAVTQKRAAIYKKIFKEKGSSKDFDTYIKSL